MASPYWRHGLVVALVIVTGAATILAHPPVQITSLPSSASLLAGTSWHVVATSKPGWSGIVWRQWMLRNARGERAALYLGVENGIKMVNWTGELAYLGAGYQVLHREQLNIQLRNGDRAPVSIVDVQRLTDRQLVAYAVVNPTGVTARTTDNLPLTVWNALREAGGPYYLIRISVSQHGGRDPARAIAVRILSYALPYLRAEARSAANRA